MNLVLTPEQEQLRDTVRRLLTDRSPMRRVREIADGADGYDPALWRQLADLGLLGLAIPEQYGGAGSGHIEQSVVAEELGRALTPTPFLGTVLAAGLLLATDDEDARKDLLPRIAAGDTIATVATNLAIAARHDGDDHLLTGRATPVLDGDRADLVLVATGDGVFAVTADSPGLTRTRLTALDPTRRLATLDLADAPARRLACTDPAAATAHLADLAGVTLAAEQVGGLLRCVEMTVDYAKIRVQFGRAIGSFQAVKHGCADMHVAGELAYSALRHATWAADHSPAELPVAASLAAAYCSAAYFQVAADTIQLHGGIGFTWEHDAHLYYKRAKTSELLFGDPTHHRAALADRLGV